MRSGHIIRGEQFHLNARSIRPWAAALFWLALTAAPLWAQGPPFQTDDPVPVELHHYEFYVFGAADGTLKEIEFWLPQIMVHLWSETDF